MQLLLVIVSFSVPAHADARPELVPEANLLDFVTSKDGDFNLCHFWSNFELGDLRWLRSKPYQVCCPR